MLRKKLAAAFVTVVVLTTTAVSAAPGPEGGSVTAIEFSAVKPNLVLAGAMGGVFRSTDGGRTWRLALPAGRPFIVKSIVFSRRNEDVYAVTNQGLYRSTDSGATWLSSDLLSGIEPIAMVVHPETSILFAATAKGLHTSRDGGKTWSVQQVGGKAGEVRSLAVDVSPPYTLLALTSAGLFASSDAKTWTLRGETSSSHEGVALGFEGTLYLWGESGNLRSVDGGRKWLKIAAVESPFDWVKTGPPKVAYARTSADLWHTEDSGMSWRKIASTDDMAVTSVAYNPVETEEIFAATLLDGVLMTSDGGEKWKPHNTGLTATHVTAIVGDPAQPGTIYAAAGHLYRSSDRGRTWSVLRRSKQIGFKDLAVTADGAIFVTDVVTPIHRSIDRGVTWSVMKQPDSATWIEADPANRQTLYTVAGMNGVFRSDDRGATWKVLDSTLPFGRLSSLVKSAPIYLAAPTSLRQSGDGGKTWSRVTLDFGREIKLHAAEVSPKRSNEVYLLTSKGMFRSVDGAGGPFALLPGLPPAPVTAIAFHPDRSESIIVTTEGEGVFASNDRGDRWVKLSGSPSHGTAIWIDRQDKTTRVLIGTPGVSIWEYDPTR